MDIQVLRFFITVAQEGGFTAASETLHYAQSNLSTRIRLLEEELGEPLFYRGKKGAVLTAKGKLFYEYADRILKLSDEAIKAIRDMDTPRGQLSIGAIEAIALRDLPDLLSAYHKAYPEVRLSLRTDMNDRFPDLVMKMELDGAFVAEYPSRKDLNVLPLKEDELMLVASAAETVADQMEYFETTPIITFPSGSIFRRRFELLLASLDISTADRLVEYNSLAAMITNIIAGLGYGYLPRSIVLPYIEQGVMRTLPVRDDYSKMQIAFIYRQDHLMDAAFRLFLMNLETYF